jgi:glucoamylase
MNAGEARKLDIATAVSETSRVWFTIAHGRIEEVFYPRPDHACVRRLRVSVGGTADDAAEHSYLRADDAVPMLAITTERAPYELTKETVADPRSNTVLQHVRWSSAGQVRLHVTLDLEHEPSAFGPIDHYGSTIIIADLGSHAVALAASAPWAACDGLGGELAVHDVTLALGFGDTPHTAAHVATAALARGYAAIREQFADEWRRWHAQLASAALRRPLWTRSACVLKTLESKHVDGGRVAALSKPWGPARAAGAWGSYHLVWTRDFIEAAGALIAAGAVEEARQAVTYLAATQRRDGHWPQNMLLDGTRVWKGDESDETALPIVYVDLLRRERLVDDRELEAAWPMVARAAARLGAIGPSTGLDRWEDTAGLTPFTLATEIAALRIAAAVADDIGDPRTAHRFATLAADRDALIDAQLYRHGGPLADQLGIAGYYVRARELGAPLPALDLERLPPTEISPDALALVRFGVRAADDPRIADTATAIDAVLRTPAGWRRYPGDRYGEHSDGTPWDGTGIGRSWPLLVGERAHFELARGNVAIAEQLCAMMADLAGPTGMLPEQTWDAPDVPQRGLWFGQPTHSAAPLGWAHAEYIKLCRSLADRRVFDLPLQRRRNVVLPSAVRFG